MSSPPVDEGTIQRAKDWLERDPNDVTKQRVSHFLQDAAAMESKTTGSSKQELLSLFPAGKRIAFGTSGLRAEMKPGPLGMNDLVVIQTAQGLARHCSKTLSEGQKPSIVIGYDHRSNPSLHLSSLSFAMLSSIVFLEAGFECIMLDGYIATPLVPFTMSQTESAVLGIMITASHNPKQDAGYKVYWKDGCQIRPPIDKEMAASILDNLDPWVDYAAKLKELRVKFLKEGTSDVCLGLSKPELTREMIERYLEAIASSGLLTCQAEKLLSDPNFKAPRFCYTAMHGVGHPIAEMIFEKFRLPPFYSVTAQQQPDPSFPTVGFPNPEEKGALDLAKESALEMGCQIVVANDPDADRLAVAEYSAESGDWTMFSGDQLGVMLGHWIWEQIGKKSSKPVVMCASTVSSKMLSEIARVEGFAFEETLTGFKWIGSKAAEMQRSGYDAIFGYEESIGYCCGNVIFDKDGLCAMGVLCELALNVYHRGLTLAEHMQSLYDKYGEFVCHNGYYFFDDPSVVTLIIDRVTNHGACNTLTKVGGYEVEAVRYLGEPGFDSTRADKRPCLPTSKSSPMLTLRFTNGCVAQFRASGTEPKLKFYIEMKGKLGVPRDAVTRDLEVMSAVILEELLQPSKHGLRLP